MSGLVLPAGWEIARLDDVALLVRGITFPTSAKGHEPKVGAVACLRTANVQTNVEWDDLWYVPRQYVKHDEQYVRTGDVLISTANSYELVGKVARVTAPHNEASLGAFISLLRAEAGLNDVYFYFLMSSDSIQRSIRDMASTTTNLSNVSGGKLKELELPIAPPAEQTRIVEKLEELLSDLDAGVAELKAAQRKLAQYRQSLLKAAMEGALTADWRATLTNTTAPQETGTELLQRILAERRARWEAKQLAKFAEQGKTPPKDWKSKYPQPVSPNSADLSPLPTGWVWATLSQVGWLDRGRSKHRPRNAPHLYGGSYPFVQTGDIREADTFIREASATYSEAGLAQSRLWPVDTVVITIAANIGKTAMLAMEACFPDSVVGFLPAADGVSIRFVEYFMRTAQQKLESEAPATAQKNINLEILERLCLPLPSMDEQLEIVRVVSDALDSAREQDVAMELALKQSAAQRKNILKAAFAGQLVPQDPNDEPASALLERIRAERAAHGSTGAKRGRTPRKTA
ncbi:MAG: restriction endonuclease subunit S [Rhodoferax sp.]